MTIESRLHARLATGYTLRAAALGERQDRWRSAKGRRQAPLTLTIPQPRLWSPERPVPLRPDGRRSCEAARRSTRSTSYFGLRKISLGPDGDGVARLLLNNQPLFQFGFLDQGFWPDGLHTPPTDEAMRFDIASTLGFGMNLARKHIKIEPERWYYWADKLGLLVWQDMPSGGNDDARGASQLRRASGSA